MQRRVVTRTFDEAFSELNLTHKERSALVWHLAAIRMRKIVETLLPQPGQGPGVNERLLDVLRTGGHADLK